ncbi:type IV secretory system conjugative DNA transfer family protein [Candidatus Berkiella aquae]|uniref:Type IV secretion system DotC family protein n=1 Tax=Candidatus Berkiella aquae TaxID=295108 RepID=A0A0Q9YX27_9GAMM|nr:type IV secretory system conjugative DNA transfer family protein [Candidatus Berkiella aquae]MCS5711132.1 type IV secretion system DotC family protein [Candidatus Berkiella aquae]
MKQSFGSMLLVGTFTVCVSCSSPGPSDVQVGPGNSTLNKYHAANNMGRSSSSLTGLRYQSIREAALSTGARAGLAWRAKQINAITYRHERQLDLIYNFHAMLLDHSVLPPILIEGRHALDQTSDELLRVSDRAYTILAQARFVTMPPTWREYLLLSYKDPDIPDRSLLPRTDSEKEVWDRYIDEGWQAGITQADVIFAENLGRLKRDYEGMVRYRSLLAQNMVSLPYVSQINLGITGGDSQMAINDRVLKITALPQFNTAGNEWTTQITPENR